MRKNSELLQQLFELCEPSAASAATEFALALWPDAAYRPAGGFKSSECIRNGIVYRFRTIGQADVKLHRRRPHCDEQNVSVTGTAKDIA
jgi:hypothetical protein